MNSLAHNMRNAVAAQLVGSGPRGLILKGDILALVGDERKLAAHLAGASAVAKVGAPAMQTQSTTTTKILAVAPTPTPAKAASASASSSVVRRRSRRGAGGDSAFESIALSEADQRIAAQLSDAKRKPHIYLSKTVAVERVLTFIERERARKEKDARGTFVLRYKSLCVFCFSTASTLL